jgi:hypothetical protein
MRFLRCGEAWDQKQKEIGKSARHDRLLGIVSGRNDAGNDSEFG